MHRLQNKLDKPKKRKVTNPDNQSLVQLNSFDDWANRITTQSSWSRFRMNQKKFG